MVDDTAKFQQMDGFGASLTDSSAWLIWNKLDTAQKPKLMQDLFSPTSGIGLSLLRQPMGASDFSASGNYSYDDVPAGQTDRPLAQFSITHDEPYIVPLLKQALSLNPAIKVIAVPWSPPAWMKSNGSMNGGDVSVAEFPAYANYFVKFIQAYQQQQVPIYAVAIQNEPLHTSPGYPTAYLSAADATAFIGQHLGPALASGGLSQVKILAYDHNWDNTQYAATILSDTTASPYVAGTAFHCYAGDVSAQSTLRDAFPSKGIWFTECSGSVGSDFSGDLVWNAQHLLIGATRNWARSISLWNIALDQDSGPKNGGCDKCRGVVTIDDSISPAKVSFNVEYYALGHLAKFVTSGAYRIASNTSGTSALGHVAFQNPDGSIALLVLNPGTTNAAFTGSWKGQTFSYTLPPKSLATFTWTL